MTRNDTPPARHRRTLLLAAGAAAFVGAPALRARAQGVDLGRVSLRIGDQTGASQAQLKAAGLLNDVPYRIEWSQYPAAVNLHEALKADATDIGAANDSPTVSAIAGGSKVSVVAGWNNGGRGTSLLVPKGSSARKMADLRGKTISPTTRGSVAHYLVVGLLKEAGIGLDEVKFAFLTPTDATAAFGSGSIDAWAIWGIFRARAIGTLGAQVVDNGERVNTGLTLLSATPSAVRDPAKLAAIRHFSALVDRCYEWGRKNRDAYIDWYAGFAKQDRAVAASVYEENVAYRRVPVDDALVARLKKTHGVWLDSGVLSGAIDFGNHVLRDSAKA
jgi:sulfonate transport system substrate-binding protein